MQHAEAVLRDSSTLEMQITVELRVVVTTDLSQKLDL